VREDSRSLTFNDTTCFEFLDFESLGFEIRDETVPMSRPVMSRGNPAKPPGMVYIFIGVVNDAVAWEMVRGVNAWTQLKCSGIRRVYRCVYGVIVEGVRIVLVALSIVMKSWAR
jgi:hypothetical protein